MHLAKDERDLFEGSSLVILAIEPQKYDVVFAKLSGLSFTDKTIVSLAPGKGIAILQSVFEGASIARAMPNTPCLIGEGMTTHVERSSSRPAKSSRRRFWVAWTMEIVVGEQSFKDLIYEIRGQKVMLDFDLPAFTDMKLSALTNKSRITVASSRKILCFTWHPMNGAQSWSRKNRHQVGVGEKTAICFHWARHLYADDRSTRWHRCAAKQNIDLTSLYSLYSKVAQKLMRI